MSDSLPKTPANLPDFLQIDNDAAFRETHSRITDAARVKWTYCRETTRCPGQNPTSISCYLRKSNDSKEQIRAAKWLEMLSIGSYSDLPFGVSNFQLRVHDVVSPDTYSVSFIITCSINAF
jgi:hypothetical protein